MTVLLDLVPSSPVTMLIAVIIRSTASLIVIVLSFMLSFLLRVHRVGCDRPAASHSVYRKIAQTFFVNMIL